MGTNEELDVAMKGVAKMAYFAGIDTALIQGAQAVTLGMTLKEFLEAQREIRKRLEVDDGEN